MQQYLKDEDIKTTDEAWVVVDKDQWGDAQLNSLFRWSQSSTNFGFALSNPKFEYWLLLHFEDGNNVLARQESARSDSDATCLDMTRT